MIFNNNIEHKLGLRYYSGGSGSGSSNQSSTSQSQSGGTSSSLSNSQAQLTPDQVLSMYQSALPQLAATNNSFANTVMGAPAANAAVTGATQGVNAINLSGLSPGEAAATERANNQNLSSTGNLGLNNGTNAISNAMNFGGAFNSKLGLLNNATNAASTAANAANNTTETATSFFNPISSNANQTTAASASNSLFGSNASSSGSGSGQNSSMQVGCFLTTACCKYKGLPDDCEELTILRKFRDSFVPKWMVEEYYKLSPSITPRIENDSVILEHIYKTITECVDDIKQGMHDLALQRYSKLVISLI